MKKIEEKYNKVYKIFAKCIKDNTNFISELNDYTLEPMYDYFNNQITLYRQDNSYYATVKICMYSKKYNNFSIIYKYKGKNTNIFENGSNPDIFLFQLENRCYLVDKNILINLYKNNILKKIKKNNKDILLIDENILIEELKKNNIILYLI